MQEIFDLLKSMPEYVKTLFTNHLIMACIAAVVFFFVLFFSNKVANTVRTFFVLAVLVFGAIGFVTKRHALLCLSIITLIILIIVRLIKYVIVTIRTNQRNKRIEERALEKAAKRRGEWKNRKGYSGERRPIVEPEYVPEKMIKEEIESVIDNEKADKPGETKAAPGTVELKTEETAEAKPVVSEPEKTDSAETEEKAEPVNVEATAAPEESENAENPETESAVEKTE